MLFYHKNTIIATVISSLRASNVRWCCVYKHISYDWCFRLLGGYVILLGFLPYFLLLVYRQLSNHLGWAKSRIE